MTTWRALSRTISLRQAAAIVFALSAVLPLLVFLFLLNRFDLLRETEVQAGLFLALLIAVLGFAVFRQMVRRMSALAQAVGAPPQAEPTTPADGNDMSMLPGLGAVAEVVQIRQAFNGMLGDLRSATDRLEDLAFKLTTLNEMVELAARIPKMQDLLTLVLERTMRTVGATAGSIMLFDRERQTLRIAAARGLSASAVADVEVKVGEEIAGTAALVGAPIVVGDIGTDPRFVNTDKRKYGSGAVLSTPVRLGDRVIGVINLAKEPSGPARRSEMQPFSPTDLQFLQGLMTYVAYAMDNARLLEETRQSNQRLKEVIEELKAAQEQLVRGETLRALSVLVSGVTHHFNNLLAVVQGRIQYLLRRGQAPEIQRSLEIAERAALDAAEVVRQVRDFSQEQPVSDAVSVDLNEVAREVIELTRPHWQDEAQLRGIQIQTAVEAGEIPPVTGDAASLREVFMSLLLNAIDALPHGGQITVRTWASSQGVRFSVADTGVGMSEEVRRRALEPFYTTKGPNSMGLGLSVTYGIIQRHGGDLTIDSAHRGTTIRVYLPMDPAVSERWASQLPGAIIPPAEPAPRP